MGEGGKSVFQKRVVRQALLVASWPLAYVALSSLSLFSTNTERVMLDVLLASGALCGFLLMGPLLGKKLHKIRVASLVCIALCGLLAALILSVGLQNLIEWALASADVSYELLRLVASFIPSVRHIENCASLLTVLFGFLWGALCVGWLRASSGDAEKAFDKGDALFALALLFGVLHGFAQPLGFEFYESRASLPWQCIVLAALWVSMLWPLMSVGATVYDAKLREGLVGRCLGLLTLGSLIANALMVLVPDVFLTKGVIAWVSMALAALVGCVACVLAARLRRRGAESAADACDAVGESAASAFVDASAMGLTAREYEVLMLAVGGANSKAIGEAVGIAPSTAREYLRRARAKLAEQGIDERDLLRSEPEALPDAEAVEAADDVCAPDATVLLMSVLVGIATSPLGAALPAGKAMVAAVLGAFALGGLVAVALRWIAPRMDVPVVRFAVRVVSVAAPALVLVIRALLWVVAWPGLVAALAVLSFVMGAASFWVWESEGVFASVFAGQETVFLLWLLALGSCDALLWVTGASGVSFVVLTVCSAVLFAGLVAALFFVGGWVINYPIACLGALGLFAVAGRLSWPAVLMCCSLAFLPWLVEGVRGVGPTRDKARLPMLVLPDACVVGALAALMLFAVWFADGNDFLLMAFFVLLALAVVVSTVVFVFVLDTSVVIAQAVGTTESDNERLLRAWLDARGVNGVNADVALGLARGEDVPALAERLGYSHSAIRKARQACYRLLGVHSVRELVRVLQTFVDENAE